LLSRELPSNRDVTAVHASIPGFGLTAQRDDILDPSFSEALAAEQADLTLNLIQPTSMFRRVMHGKACPQPAVSWPVDNVTDIDAAKSRALQVGAELGEPQAFRCEIEVITLYNKT